MTNYHDDNFFKAINFISQFSEQKRYEKICELSENQKEKYKRLLDNFKTLHNTQAGSEYMHSNLHNLKGTALEDLVNYLLSISGNLFKVDRNLRTKTNEIDQVVSLTGLGKILICNGLIPSKLNCFLGECKNYNSSISVTYVGKFCSLLLTTQIKLGIIFSYNGVSGKNWSNASGLIKKFYLSKEKEEDRFCIIDFSINEFEQILEGKNFLQIIDDKLKSLQFDTDYLSYIQKHPAEDKLDSTIKL